MQNQIEEFNIGNRRKLNPDYRRLMRNGRLREAHLANIQPNLAKDTTFKRMKYVRYADDFIIGIIGSKKDCIIMRDKVAKYLYNELKLSLNIEKTKITHATSDLALFLGTQIRTTPYAKKPYRNVIRGEQKYLMKSNTNIQLVFPAGRTLKKLYEAGICKKNGKPTR